MSWFQKISQAFNVQLKKGIHTQSNRAIYYLVGDTYPLHQSLPLGRLGFHYWKTERMWWIYAEQMTSEIVNKLSKVGVDISSYTGQKPFSKPQPTSEPSTPTPMPIPTPTPMPKTKEPDTLTDKSWEFENKWSNEKLLSDKAGFPYKKIYTQDIDIDFQGNPVTLRAVLTRRPRPGKTDYSVAMGWRGFPLYVVNVYVKENEAPLGKFILPINKENKERKWETINETAEVVSLIEPKVREIYTNTATKGYKQLTIALQRKGRDPEFTQFLQKHRAFEENPSKILKSITINDPVYGGTYPVSFHASHDGETWYGETAVEHPLAPHPKTVFYMDMPFEVQTIDQFNQWLDTAIQTPQNVERAQQEYIQYLKSFPYLEEEQNVAQESMKEILPIIKSKSMDVVFFRNKLLQNGYIRPSKRQARTGPGMVPQESIKMVIDAKKIVDDIYRYGKHANNPNFFYAVIAYYMHRLKSGNIGFMPIMLMDAVRHLKDVLKRFGEDIDFKDLDDYLESVGRHLLQSLFDVRNARTAWDQWDQFYSGNWGQGSGGTPAKNEYTRIADLNEFITFATIYGISPEQAKNSPKSTFRQLAIKLHPDTSSNPDKEQAAADFISLKEIWDRIPDHLKNAFLTNWLCRIKYAHNRNSS